MSTVTVGPDDDPHVLCLECLHLIDFDDHGPGCPEADQAEDDDEAQA